MIVVREVLHDVLRPAVEKVAQTVDGVDFQILVPAETVQHRAVDVVVGIQVVLGNAALLHGFPKPIIIDHAYTSKNILTHLHYPHKMEERIVFTKRH